MPTATHLVNVRLAYFGVGATPRACAQGRRRRSAGGSIDAAVAALASDLDPADDLLATGAGQAVISPASCCGASPGNCMETRR